MSYRCGTTGLSRIGIPDSEPIISCDGHGCGVKLVVRGRGAGGVPPAWLLDGKPPPKWGGVPGKGDELRRDFCPICRVAGRAARGGK